MGQFDGRWVNNFEGGCYCSNLNTHHAAEVKSGTWRFYIESGAALLLGSIGLGFD